MNDINKTLYIPLYSKAYVSNKNLILKDTKAQEIFSGQTIKLKRKSKSKWLAYYLSIRCAVIDDFLKNKINEDKDAVILHLGCGLDSRICRVNNNNHYWYDVDFLDVINERKKYFKEDKYYKMIEGNLKENDWLEKIIKSKKAIIILEGISMYLTLDDLKHLFENLSNHFDSFVLLMDCYSSFAAKMSRIKNPINDVGVREVFGIDNPIQLNTSRVIFKQEHEMTPIKYINELKGFEKFIFKNLYAGKTSKKLYKLYEYNKQ